MAGFFLIIISFWQLKLHRTKSVCFRSFSGPYYCAFVLNTERYSVSLRTLTKCGKIWTRKIRRRTLSMQCWVACFLVQLKNLVLCRRKQSRYLLKLTFWYSVSKHYNFVWFHSHVTLISFQHLFCYTAKVFDDFLRIISLKWSAATPVGPIANNRSITRWEKINKNINFLDLYQNSIIKMLSSFHFSKKSPLH